MFAVTVEFTLDPAQRDAFMPLMLENAARSREDEPGCRQFDVCTDATRPTTIVAVAAANARKCGVARCTSNAATSS